MTTSRSSSSTSVEEPATSASESDSSNTVENCASSSPTPTDAPSPNQNPTADGPTPVIAGTFAIYEAPDGGYVLVTDIPGQGVSQKHIPGALVKMISGNGMMAKQFGRLFGGK